LFEDRNLAEGRFGIGVVGNATGSTTFQLGLPTGTTGGTNGVIIQAPPGTGPFLIASNAQLQFVLLYGCTFRGFTDRVEFSFNATNAPNHEIFNCLFSGCAEIEVGRIQFKNNRIVGGAPAITTEAFVLFPPVDTNFEDLQFQAGLLGNGIRFDTAGTFELRDIFFSGFSASLVGATFHTITGVDAGTEVITTDAVHGFATEEPVVLNDLGGADTVGLTENTIYYARALSTTTLSFHTTAANAASDTARVDLSDGSTGQTQSLYSANAAIINDSGGLVTINVVQLTLDTMKDNTEVRVYAQGTTTPELAGIENATAGTTDDRNFAFSLASGLAVDIRIFAIAYEPADILNIKMAESTIPIQQRFDRTYTNPD